MDIQNEQPEPVRHIESKPNVCGGKPCVAGTRNRVWDIDVRDTLQRQAPEVIVADFPQLSIADVHAAIAYYFDHREQIEHQMKEAQEFSAQMEAEQGPTKFTQLRDSLRRSGKEDDSNPVPS